MVSGGRLSSGLTIILVATVALTIPTTGDDHWGEDREATYAGGTRVEHEINEQCDDLSGECPLFVTKGLTWVQCDSYAGLFESGIQGVGGVLFCGIEIGATINVTIHDALHSDARGEIRCPNERQFTGVVTPTSFSPMLVTTYYNITLGEPEPSVTFTVSEGCLDYAELNWDPPGHTDLWVPLYAGFATAGTVTLEHVSSG